MLENKNILNELLEVSTEYDREKAAREDGSLQSIAEELLKLERDMRIGGSGNEAARVERILKFIAERDF